ncbi:MAG: hypothetical protein ACOCP5_00460 [Halanaerobiaceae bacterium]
MGRLKISKLKKREKILFIIFLVLFLIFTYYYLWFRPLDKKIVSIKLKNNNKYADMQRIKNSISDYPVLYRKNKKLNRERGDLEYLREKNVLDQVKLLCEKHEIVLEEFETVKEKTDFNIKFKLKTNFNNIYNFLHELEQWEKVIEFKELNIYKNPEGFFSKVNLIVPGGEKK